jgi:hypothetical protein
MPSDGSCSGSAERSAGVSDDQRRRGRPSLHQNWTRERLVAMDAHFIDAVEHAIGLGLERRPKGERERAA